MLDYPVPPPGPPGPFGTITWLRATVSRFAEGETHARRRALVEYILSDLDPARLRDEAAEMTRAGGDSRAASSTASAGHEKSAGHEAAAGNTDAQREPE